MSKQINFKELVGIMLDRYRDTSIPKRLKEATMLNPNLESSAFWVRETDDLVNIVWLTDKDIRDIAWFPKDKSSSLDVVLYSAVTAYQIREAPNVGMSHGLNVSGNYIVTIHTTGKSGILYWVASSRKEEDELCNFVTELTKKLG